MRLLRSLMLRSVIPCLCATAALLGTVGGFASAQAQAPAPAASGDSDARAGQVLADARQALGGSALDAVKTLIATGHTRRVRGNNLVPIEFEIFIELPDKYVRVDEFPAEDTDPTSSGFNGSALVQNPAPAAPPAGGGAPPGQPPGPGPGPRPGIDPRQMRIVSIKQDYTRLALGMFAASTAMPLTFTYAAVAEAPQGQADVLDAKGEANVALRLFINRQTRLPIMVTWNTPPTNVIVTVPGQDPPKTIAPGAVVVTGPPPPPAGAPKEEFDKYAKDVLAIRAKAQATAVEHRLYFGDYRDVDGVKLPFRVRRAIGQETTEETTFDRFRINTRIDPKRFDPVK
jgi:hypothetical protein